MTQPIENYASQHDVTIASAEAVVPIIAKLFSPKKIIDIGCGVGTWLSVFSRYMPHVQGVDGEWVNRTQLLIPKENFEVADLTQPYTLKDTYDLAVCLEVGEHLPSAYASQILIVCFMWRG